LKVRPLGALPIAMLGWLFDKGEGELDGDDEHAVAFDLSDPTSTKSGPNQPLSPDRVPPFSTAGYSFSALQHNPSPGFASFVVEHSNALLELIGLRDERLALAHLAEHDALVIGVPDDYHGELPKAFVTLNDGADVDGETLTAWLNPKVGKHERVQAVVVRDELPKTMIGKLDRKALRTEEGV